MTEAVSSQAPRVSGSFAEALQWAEASAALRGPNRPVAETDLFLGTLLAHPDADGEMRRLIGYFGLTARDLLPDDFPKVTLDSLRLAAATVDSASPRSRDPRVNQLISTAERLAGNRTPTLADLVGAMLSESQIFQQALQRSLDRSGFSVSTLADEYRGFLSTFDPATEVAGRRIGDWLGQRFPRKPASLAAFSSDVIDPAADFVDVSIEADAFAYLISSHDLVPPLAIGLFGEWGSGKSFLMAKIRHRIIQLTRMAGSADVAGLKVWSNVAHIEFNAWEYVETNLWASLLDRIFSELGPDARQKLSDRRRADTMKELGDKESHVAAAEEKVDNLRTAETKAADAVRTKEELVDEVVRTTARLRDSLIAGELESTAGSALIETLVAVGKETAGQEVTGAVEAVRKAAGATRTSPWLHQEYWTWRRILYLVLAAAVVPAVAFLMDKLSAPPLPSVLLSLAPLIPAAALVLKGVAKFATEQQAALATAERLVDEKLAAAVNEVKESLAEATGELEQAQEKLASAAMEADQARSEKAELERHRDALTAGYLLAEYLADRNASDDYRGELGMVSKVHKDLQDLADLTAEFNADSPQAAGPPNRIVLYIDDLDRCPPKKVVEVLEAVHLLLSFPLFVVVVAVDTRWLTSALHTALPALDMRPSESGVQPNAMDYVEKIFQIPFWVEELDDDARRRLLRGLLLPSVEVQPTEGGGDGNSLQVGEPEEELVKAMLTDYGSGLDLDARQLSLSPDELAFIESLAPLMGGTPRRVKRFVNICQLLLAMAPPLAAGDVLPTERMATCFMAALHEGLPKLAARLAKVTATSQPTLRGALAALDPVELTAERERLKTWLKKQQELAPAGTAPFDLTPMSRFLIRFDLIRRLTFEVGSL